MHQLAPPLKSTNNPKPNSVKFFHFNSEWTHSCHQQTKHIPTLSDNMSSHTNRLSVQKSPKPQAIYPISHKQLQQIYDSRFTHNFSETTQVYPKKKAYSQLQSYKKLQLSVNPIRFSKPSQQISQNNCLITIQKPLSQNQLVVNSIKLSPLKLPQIKTSLKQNHIIKKIKLQNLRVINIQDRIKTMKFTPEKQHDQSFNSQVTTELLKNKIKNISKLNKKFLEDRNRTEAIETQISERQTNDQPTQKIFKINKKMFKKDYFQENHSVQLKKFSKKQSTKKIEPQMYNQKIKTKQNIENQSQEKEEQSSLPKLQVYDKKMKIGRKKKSQEDRIRAILLKTLEKTKGSDYVAQQGSSQKKNTPRNSMPQTKRQLSKQGKQASNERVSLVLGNDQKVQQSPNRKSSFRRVQLQKLKKSLNPANRNSETREPSTYIKNKKFVQMVREVQNRKNNHELLQQIKEEKTLSKEQNEEDSNYEDPKTTSIPVQHSSEVSENEFLPNSARLKLKQCK